MMLFKKISILAQIRALTLIHINRCKTPKMVWVGQLIHSQSPIQEDGELWVGADNKNEHGLCPTELTSSLR